MSDTVAESARMRRTQQIRYAVEEYAQRMSGHDACAVMTHDRRHAAMSSGQAVYQTSRLSPRQLNARDTSLACCIPIINRGQRRRRYQPWETGGNAQY